MTTTDETILIWGAGAIGGLIGAYLARSGRSVSMVDIDAEHAKCCSKTGLQIQGPVENFTQIIPCVTPSELQRAATRPFQTIILAVKAHMTETALDMLMPHLAQDGVILSAQNGLNEMMISERAGAERTMGAFVNFGADWLGPGQILYGNRGAVVIGELDGQQRPRTTEMLTNLQVFEPDAIITDNIWGYLWGKLGYGAMLFATALTPDSMSENFSHSSRRPTLAGLAREVMRVAQKQGINPKAFNGFEPAAYWPGADHKLTSESLDSLAAFNAKTAKTHSGIYRDLAIRKRQTEVGPQVGKIVEIAHKHGLEVPLLTRLVQLIEDIENGRRTQSAQTFAILSEMVQ